MDNVFSLRDRVLSELRCYTAPRPLALAADRGILGILGPRSPRLENHQQRGSGGIYTIWLFNIAMERSTMLLIGKPSISIRAILYHGYVK